MAITIKSDLPASLGSEYDKFQSLVILGSTRTATGNTAWTSTTSGTIYDTSASSDPNILNKGQNGLFYYLSQTLSNYILDNAWIVALVQSIINSAQVYATDSGSSDAYAISLPTAPTAYTLGMSLSFRANTANTDACTLNVNGLGAKTIKDINGKDLQTGVILVGQIVTVAYDGTYFIMVSPSANKTTQDDGWKPVYETWTYASATTITVPTGAASRYQRGDKIKITNSTVKYFYIVVVADTLLTVTGGNDYTLTNTAISNVFVSKTENPQGFPSWFNWTPTFGAVSPMTWTSSAATLAQFHISSGILFYRLISGTGAPGGTLGNALTFTAPVIRTGTAAYELCGLGVFYNGTSSHGTCHLCFNNASPSSIIVQKYDESNYTTDSGTTFRVEGFYQIA